MRNQTPVNYPPKLGGVVFRVRAKSASNRVIRFPSIKPTDDYERAVKDARRVAKRPDVRHVKILTIPAAR